MTPSLEIFRKTVVLPRRLLGDTPQNFFPDASKVEVQRGRWGNDAHVIAFYPSGVIVVHTETPSPKGIMITEETTRP